MYSEKVLRNTLRDLWKHKITEDRAFSKLKNLPYEVLDFARIDHHRHFRKGFPEVVYSPGKTFAQIVGIVRSLQKSGQSVLVTRLDQPLYKKLKKHFPSLHYSKEGRIAYARKKVSKKAGKFSEKPIAVLTAGTSDIPVAEEAAVTLEVIGRPVERIYDCGIAALHRLFDKLKNLNEAKAIICVAGMEGALPNVVAGLVDKPVIAVPTSVGYGASFKGLSALLTMMNSCTQGIAVVNVDNGFGAACFASML